LGAKFHCKSLDSILEKNKSSSFTLISEVPSSFVVGANVEGLPDHITVINGCPVATYFWWKGKFVFSIVIKQDLNSVSEMLSENLVILFSLIGLFVEYKHTSGLDSTFPKCISLSLE